MDKARKVMKINLAIDVGSSAIKAVYRRDDSDMRIQPVCCWDYGIAIRDTGGIDITKSQQSLPNRVYFNDSGDMDIGMTDKYRYYEGSKRALSQKLFPDGEAEVLRRVLDEHSLTPRDVLCLILKKTLAAFHNTVYHDHHLKKQDYMFGDITLSMPEMFAQGDECGADIQAEYIKAAEDAGFPKDQLRVETEAMLTAVYLLKTLPDNSYHEIFQPMTRVHIVDLGDMSWDVITIAIVNGKFVQDQPPQGGVGGMGEVWAKLRRKFDDDEEMFELIKKKCCSLQDFQNITISREVRVEAEELRGMFAGVWESFLESMQDWFKDESLRQLRIVGGAPTSSPVVQYFLREELGNRGIEALFPIHPDPTHAVCRGAITPWNSLDPVGVLEKSQIGFVVSHQEAGSKLRELAVELKSVCQPLQSIKNVFESVESSGGEIQIWLYYSESGKALGKQCVPSCKKTNPMYEYRRDDATLIDPIKIKIADNDNGVVHFRFIKESTSQTALYLELYSDTHYIVQCLEITRDRTRVLLEQKDSKLLAEYTKASNGTMSELCHEVAIKGAGLSAALRQNAKSKIACLQLAAKTELLIRVPTPQFLSQPYAPSQKHSTETGYYTLLILDVTKGEREGTSLLTTHLTDDGRILDVFLIRRKTMRRYRLTLTCQNGILSVEECSVSSKVQVGGDKTNCFPALKEWHETGVYNSTCESGIADLESFLIGTQWEATSHKRYRQPGEVTQQPVQKRVKSSCGGAINASPHDSTKPTQPQTGSVRGNVQLDQITMANHDTGKTSLSLSTMVQPRLSAQCEEQIETAGTTTNGSHITRRKVDSTSHKCVNKRQNQCKSSTDYQITRTQTFNTSNGGFLTILHKRI